MTALLALTLTQPWATLVALGAKRYETRSWRTRYQGTLTIHAAKGFPAWARAECAEEPFATALGGLNSRDLPIGAIVAVAELVRCVPTDPPPPMIGKQEISFGDWSPGRWAWELKDVRALATPIPCRGALSLWPVRKEELAMIDEQFASEYPDHDYLDEAERAQIDFADPGGRSALRAATADNLRNLPCPNCLWPSRLTPVDVAQGYQCDSCADAAERGVDVVYYEEEA